MTSTPICNCGRDAKQVDLARDGLTIATGWLCSECLDEMLAEMDVKRAQFEDLLAAGVPRDKASDIMIARMEGEAVS